MGEALPRHSRREPRRSLAHHHGSHRARPIAISTAISSMPSAMPPGARCSARRCCRRAAGWWWSPTMAGPTPSPAPTARSPIGASMGVPWTSFRFRMHAGSGQRSRAARTPSAPSCFCGTRRRTARTPRPRSINLFKLAGKGLKRIDRTHRDGRLGTCLIAGSTEEALRRRCGACQGGAQGEARAYASSAISVIVLGGDLEPDKKLVVRLQSADDLPGLPLDCVLATEAYRGASQVRSRREDPAGAGGPRRNHAGRARTASGRPCAAGPRCRSTRWNGPRRPRWRGLMLRKFKPDRALRGP